MDLGRLPDLVWGESYGFDIVVEDPITEEPVDLTGSTIMLTFKSNPVLPDDDAELKHTLTVDPDQVANKGLAFVNVPPAETQVKPGEYHYDIKMIDSGGIVDYITEPNLKLTVYPAITQRTS